MKTTNLRNKPVDRRRLSEEDRASYRPANRMQAAARAKQRRGQLAWENKVAVGKQEHSPGTGGLSFGRGTQAERQRIEGAKVQRSKALRPEDPAGS